MKEDSNIRVAQVIGYDKIVINKGIVDGIDADMEFLVYVEGSEIKDPISGNSLGNLEKPKGFFRTFHIQEKMTTLIAKLSKQDPVFSLMPFAEKNPEIEALKTIRIGDKVKIINLIKK